MIALPALALINGKFWTVNKQRPWAEAILISGNKIVAIGSTSQIKQFIDSKTKVIDL